MEGTTDSHLTIETSSNAFEKIFIRRDGTNTLVGDWQVDSVINPFNINMFGNFITAGNITAKDSFCLNSDCSSRLFNNGTHSIWE